MLTILIPLFLLYAISECSRHAWLKHPTPRGRRYGGALYLATSTLIILWLIYAIRKNLQ